MTDITQISKGLQNIFGDQANQLARETRFVQREVKVTGSNFAQTLVFGFLNNPKMSYRSMSQAASLSSLAITAQGLEQKFSKASADFMKLLLEKAVKQLISASNPKVELLHRFSRIHIQDSSVIGLPDECVESWQGLRPKEQKGCAALKLHVSLDYNSGQLFGPVLVNAREHDQKSPFFCQTLNAGELRLVDLGFFKLNQLKADAQAGGFWIIRHKVDTLLFHNNEPLPLLPFLRQQSDRQIDIQVQLGKNHRIPCRLLAIKVDDQTAEKRKRNLREYARRKQVTLSAERLALAHWTIFLTNVPQTQLSLIEAYALLRLRWQIELLFRLWKSYAYLDESESKNPWRILTELYAKLIAVLVQHWFILISVWKTPEKSIVQAALVIRKLAILLHMSINHLETLCTSISTILHLLHFTPALLRRKKKPSTIQILQNPKLALC